MRVRAFNKMSPLRGCEAGQSLMEFALVLPLLLLLLLGIIQFGAAFNALIVLNAAAQEGARVMAIEGAGAEAEAEAKAVVLDRCTAAPFLSCNETDIDIDIKLKANEFKEVTVTVPGTVPLFLFIFSESELSLAGKAIMRLEPVIQEAP